MKKIAVIGNICHGKTTLISAISFVFGTERINCSGNPRDIFRTETKVEFDGEEYLFFDYPDIEDFEKNLDGTEDGAVLVVAATEGPMPGTEESVELCRNLGIEKIVVFLNNCDQVSDDDLVDFIEYDVEDLLSEQGFEDCRFIRGSAYYADMHSEKWDRPIKELVEAVAEEI